MSENKTMIIIAGNPIKDFPDKTQLEKEQPGLLKYLCPHCDEPMWLSAKKRKMLSDSEDLIMPNGDKIMITCWTCVKEKPEELGINTNKLGMMDI